MSSDTKSPSKGGSTSGRQAVRRPRRVRVHHRIYMSLLVFVVAAGLPIVGVPSLRQRLRTRVETLRAAALGQPVAPAPALARVGDNLQPFPREYEHPVPPSYLPKFEPAPSRQPYRLSVGGVVTTLPSPKTETQPSVPLTSGVPAATGQPAAETATAPQYSKGKSEQEAYDLLVNANQNLAGMIKGSDPALKFQDWSAANMGGDSYYVMLTFVQSADKVVKKYIWNVKLMAKTVVPVNAAAMSIAK